MNSTVFDGVGVGRGAVSVVVNPTNIVFSAGGTTLATYTYTLTSGDFEIFFEWDQPRQTLSLWMQNYALGSTLMYMGSYSITRSGSFSDPNFTLTRTVSATTAGGFVLGVYEMGWREF